MVGATRSEVGDGLPGCWLAGGTRHSSFISGLGRRVAQNSSLRERLRSIESLESSTSPLGCTEVPCPMGKPQSALLMLPVNLIR